MKEQDVLRWKFDVNTFRLLGRELITDRITALFELVKNCYDANAERVEVEFYDVQRKSTNSKIIIRDNGIGMTLADVENKWMVIGTNSKRTKHHSDPPFERRFIGEKGIGRFAVDKLGTKLLMKTKKKGDSKQLCVEINWNVYEELAKRNQTALFTEVDNSYYFTEADSSLHGTELIISCVNEIWTRNDIERAYKELSKLVSPFETLDPPFDIYVSSNEHAEYFSNKRVATDAIKFASHEFFLKFHADSKQQDILRFDKNKSKLITTQEPTPIFGGVQFKLYYFNEEAKVKFKNKYKLDEVKIDGIKIYRDGIVTTPFAEFEANEDKKRDILGIDKRKWSGVFDKVSTRNTIGIVNITKEGNPKIVDATNRQDFVDNEEYRELKTFIIQQLEELEKLLKDEKNKVKDAVTEELKKTSADAKELTQAIKQVAKDVVQVNPFLKDQFDALQQKVENFSSSIKKSVKQTEEVRKEFTRKENIYLSLMSLQDYAVHIAHAVRTSLGKIKKRAEFFKKRFPDPKFDSYFSQYANEIYDEMITLNKTIDFMLSYASSNTDVEEFNVKKLIEELFYSSYQPVFEAECIDGLVEIKDSFILTGNKKFFEDIIVNLIANSIKAVKDKKDKLIKCSGYIDSNKFVCYFSDNGYGIPEENKNKIFEMFFTTTAEQGGAGLGLFIVKTRIEALKGDIELVESELKPSGTTFKITLPFNNSSSNG